MPKPQSIRRYIILRPANGHAAGFARLEGQHGRGRMVIHAQQLACKAPALRALMLSGDAATGAVLDLGLMPLDPRSHGQLTCSDLALQTIGGGSGYHTLVLTTDWPSPELQLYGWLTEHPRCTLWQMKDMLRRHLAIPAADSAPAPVEPDPPKERHAPPGASVLSLRPVEWPEELAELKIYFDSLPPVAPFDAPGWRFVSVPLPERQPAPRCEVGVLVQDGRVTQAVYALPGQPAPLPPEGLQGYQWHRGRSGQGYWVYRQAVEA